MSAIFIELRRLVSAGLAIGQRGGWLVVLALMMISCSLPSRAEGLRGAVLPEGERTVFVDRLEIRKATGGVTLALEFSDEVEARTFVLGNPYRIIVDLPALSFRLAQDSGPRHGLIRAYRFGGFAPGRSRMVFDLSGPAVLSNVAVKRSQGTRRRLTMEIQATDAAQFAALEAAGLVGPPRQTQAESDAPRPGRAGGKSRRPVVVIDPGHGGLDPGAVAGAGVTEKDVVLAVGRKLAARLRASGRYEVLMTREGDEFLSLRKRLDFSREAGADLFLSLHADALPETEGLQDVGGATVYTLSEKASDEAARRLAEKENSADLAAGLQLGDSDEEDKVRGILFDLLRRETSVFSSEFRKLVINRLKPKVKVSRSPARSAAFAVLKQTETPSVLIELGFISNGADRKNLVSPAWQAEAAKSLAGAVELYFASPGRKSGAGLPGR